MERPPPPEFAPLPLERDPFLRHCGPLYLAMRPSQSENGSPVSVGFFVLPHHANPSGACHGGMLMMVMDIALGHAVLHAAPDPGFTPTMTMTHDFLRSARVGDWIESRVDLVHTTRRTGFANGTLIGPAGPVARSSAVFRLNGQAAGS